MINDIKSNSKFKNIFIILSFLFLSIFSFILLIRTHSILMQGDIAFHFRRILELKDSICHGNLLPEYSFNQYPGSSIMSLYPYINLYPIALLAIFIKSKIALLYIWYISNIFLLFLVSYYSSHCLNKSFYISYLFSVAYGLSSTYFLSGLDDFGEMTSFALLPLVIFGCINWLNQDKYIELAIGLSLIIFSHVLTTFMSLIFILVWIIVNCSKLNKHKFVNLLKCFGLTSCLTSLVWLPALIFKLSSNVPIFTPARPALSCFYGNASFNLIELLKQGLNIVSPSNQLTFLAVIGIFLVLCFYKNLDDTLHKLFWLACFFMLLGTNNFPWKYAPRMILKLFGIFQNPQRLMILAQLLLCYLFAVIIIKYVTQLKSIRFRKYLLLLPIVLLLMFVIYKHSRIYIGLGVILLSMLLILVLKQNNVKIVKITLFLGVILFSMFTQIYMQNLVVLQHVQGGHVITKEFYQSHIKHSRKGVSKLDSINKNSQFKYFISLQASPTHDYYPKKSLSKLRLINNHYGLSPNNKIRINHIGYNQFSFNPRHKVNKITLPLLDYNNSNLRLRINNHLIHYYPDQYRRVVINGSDINKGHNVLKVNSKSHALLDVIKILMLIVGLLWLVRDYFYRMRSKSSI